MKYRCEHVCKEDLVVIFSYIAVFDCERTELYYFLLPECIGCGLKIMEGVFSSKLLSGTGILSVI